VTQTRKEILEQPEVLTRVIDRNWPVAQKLAEAIRKAGIEYAVIAARGTSDNAAIYAKYLMAMTNGIPVALASPSLYTHYGRPPRLQHSLTIGISQSGASTDIVQMVETARSQGALTLAITNDEDSALANAADMMMPCLAGPELAVAATKTYTAELACIALLSVALGNDTAKLAELKRVPGAVAEALRLEQTVKQAAERYCYMTSCVMLSRGLNYSTANEIALKTKELAYVLTQAYSTADFMHGPLASIGPRLPVFSVVATGALHDNLLESLATVKERGGEMIVVSDSDAALAMARTGFRIPSMPEWLSPMVAVIPGQWFAHYLALSRDYDPDHPRALHKVTLTL
jgi:glutamine---fructose-6-phosphate transaminase (isomerizing)